MAIKHGNNGSEVGRQEREVRPRAVAHDPRARRSRNGRRRALTTTIALVIAVGSTLFGGVGNASAGATSSRESSTVVHAWERTSIRTIYTDNVTPIPVGVVYLGFTSLAMYEAAQSARRHHGSQVAAIAQAAHEVLAQYYPASASKLSADLAVTLGGLAPGAATQRGIDAGKRVAQKLIASRADDGRNDTTVVYNRDVEPGVWQGVAGTPMLAPWLGFVRTLVVHKPITVDGPDAIISAQYAADYAEVKASGGATGSDRTAQETETAQFFNSNSATMTSEALLRYLDNRPMSLLDTARLFAAIHTSMTDAVITCWRLKYEVGFWRPFEAIRGAATDGNPATTADATWTPLLATPPYGDYVSGHGCLTSPAIESIRQTLGENTSLTLHSYNLNTDRVYPNLRSIERDALESRIWGGLHFRHAMDDSYAIGHKVADLALRKLGDARSHSGWCPGFGRH
jgi:hypothetical protein